MSKTYINLTDIIIIIIISILFYQEAYNSKNNNI